MVSPSLLTQAPSHPDRFLHHADSPPNSQAELGSFIVVGCVPYLPRLIRYKQLRGGSYAAKPTHGTDATGKSSQKKSAAKSKQDTERSLLESGEEGVPMGNMERRDREKEDREYDCGRG